MLRRFPLRIHRFCPQGERLLKFTDKFIASTKRMYRVDDRMERIRGHPVGSLDIFCYSGCTHSVTKYIWSLCVLIVISFNLGTSKVILQSGSGNLYFLHYWTCTLILYLCANRNSCGKKLKRRMVIYTGTYIISISSSMQPPTWKTSWDSVDTILIRSHDVLSFQSSKKKVGMTKPTTCSCVQGTKSKSHKSLRTAMCTIKDTDGGSLCPIQRRMILTEQVFPVHIQHY